MYLKRLGCVQYIQLLLLASQAWNAAGTRTEVTSLPGYKGGNTPLPTKTYTGFVEVDAQSKSTLFYMLVEAQSDPAQKPLIWWFNGGPGASSLAGAFGENGPLLLTEQNTLLENPYSWTSIANVLFVEFAPGVGYSFCANSTDPLAKCPQESGECSPCPTSDSQVVDQNIAFLDALLVGSKNRPALFPELRGRELFLAGESYAGVYIPTLAQGILHRVQDTSIINLIGFWVTDPCTDNRAQFGWLDLGVQFAYEKGIISRQVRDTLKGSDCSTGTSAVGDLNRKTDILKCRQAWRLYDISLAGLGNAVHPEGIPQLPMYIDPLNAYGPSGGADLPAFLGREDVRKAMHAEASANKVYHIELGNNGYPEYHLEYLACNPTPNAEIKNSMLDVYRDIVLLSSTGTKSAANLRTVIISSGDIDPVVALHGTENAVEALGYPKAMGGTQEELVTQYAMVRTCRRTYETRPIGTALSDAGLQKAKSSWG
ncbi:hypothetical protein CYMTET_26469 [Cymbomonas tetramitiformis]|uniref:Carboxypeptidase n=1 Tax=Cymbomonas tetramitiformis TaxID=36881 RepID=A0AAE0KY47_9CHLO|nr:hypothetical protein CYMTET_26469 [Cymbomonas tetramitiformis]